MSKRFLSELSFIILIAVYISFYFESRNPNIENTFVFTLLILWSLLAGIGLILKKFGSFKNHALIILLISFTLILLSYLFLCEKQRLLSEHLEASNLIEGLLYFDDPVHRENANLLFQLRGGLNISYSYKLRVYGKDRLLDNVVDGDRILAKMNLIEMKDKSNLGEFDYKNYLRGIGIHGTAYVSEITNKNTKELGLLYSYRAKILKNLYGSISAVMKEADKIEFIYALVSGSKSELDEGILEAFKTTSTLHLLTVSGFHFAIIYFFIDRFMMLLRFPRNIRLMILLFIMYFYYLITPMKFSCFRALAMIVLLIVSKLLNRQFDFLTSFSMVVILSLILNPYVLYDLSFLLTYLACIGIGVIYKEAFELEGLLKVRGRIISNTSSVFLMSLSIQISLLLYYLSFDTDINLLGPIINIPLSFLFTFLIYIVLICLLLVGIYRSSLDLIYILPSLVVNIIFEVIGYFSSLDIFIVSLSKYKSLLIPMIFTYIGAIYIRQNFKRHRYLDLGLILVCIFLISSIITSFQEKSYLEIIFNDVGQGDSSMIITEDKKVIVIDLGDGRVDVGKLMKARGISKIDLLIISHNHKDHNGGQKEWLSNIVIDKLIVPKHMEDTSNYLSDETIRADTITKVEIGDLKLDIYPLFIGDENLNNMGLLVKLNKDNLDILFTGDMEKEAEDLVLGSELLNSIDILKVAHHGSKTSSTKEFVDEVSPIFAIIPVGINTYNHPSYEVVKRYREAASKLIILRDYGQVSFIYRDGVLTFKSYFNIGI